MVSPVKRSSSAWQVALAGVALGGLGFGAAQWVERRPPAADVPDTASSQDDGAAELQRLRAELRRVRARLGRLEQAPQASVVATKAVEPVDEAPEPELTPAERAVHEVEQVEQEVRRLHDLVDTSPRDARWAEAYERSLEDSLAGDVFAGSDVTEVTCADELCRVQVVHESAEAMAVFEREIPERAPENQGGFYRHGVDAQGNPSSVLFIAPKGSTALLTPFDDT